MMSEDHDNFLQSLLWYICTSIWFYIDGYEENMKNIWNYKNSLKLLNNILYKYWPYFKNIDTQIIHKLTHKHNKLNASYKYLWRSDLKSLQDIHWSKRRGITCTEHTTKTVYAKVLASLDGHGSFACDVKY